jgi:metallo-beta-lactamase class B
MRFFPKRRWVTALLCSIVVVGGFLFSQWRTATKNGGQKYAEPFRIAGNLYYVGANDVTSFLITSPQGHVLIDGGYPGTAPMIMKSIAQLGFNIRDVKVLLNSHSHYDHAGGLAELQKASGAELWVSEGDADAVAHGGAGDQSAGMFRLIPYLVRYPAPRVDHRFKDRATIRVGPTVLTANVTPGHTRGCTSWSFPVRDGNRELLAVHICSVQVMESTSLVEPETYPGVRADFEHSFQRLRSLPADIWLASHAREFGRWRKFQQRSTAKNPAEPFIDHAGYVAAIDSAEARFQRQLARQQREGPPSFMRMVRDAL